MTHLATSMQRRSGARFSASSRPIPRNLRRRTSSAGIGALPINLAVRMTVIAIMLAFLALAALVVMAPAKVTIPLATVLVLGFAIGGVVALIDRHRSRVRIMGGAGLSSSAPARRRLR
ncbi:MAG TPA: hypothetical protein VJ802_07155 [Gemmatimonadaceae bacterium]|nr:hypothetical protein [Gemmatimonadaceae bacterium]